MRDIRCVHICDVGGAGLRNCEIYNTEDYSQLHKSVICTENGTPTEESFRTKPARNAQFYEFLRVISRQLSSLGDVNPETVTKKTCFVVGTNH